MKETKDLTDAQLAARDVSCFVVGVVLMLVGAWACVWFVWGVVTLHVVGTVEGLLMLPCWLFGITLIDIAVNSTTDGKDE
ncbi:hypothetical protein [Bifidobacterium thermacidophilum]|uniref:Uncharacterized protein n=1 Tax=Bifidobacterium thermacidophilum subsp. thermacidophilum TaxID=79262 RepID=A0A087E4G3_9BIFI|nr:hypothetical protein [Bifidobacterium thermacidophilum]KFJ02664.1 hypothetical protein THER5_1127 [Bifidobacterium thermacidophilum subsp. thermacidophilum]